MSLPNKPITGVAAAWLVWSLACCSVSQAEPPPTPIPAPKDACEDMIAAKVQVAPELTFKFFTSLETSRPWHITGNPDEGLEDTMDGSIDEEDLILLEHTSACTSTHQGEHLMSFCETKSTEHGGVALFIHGGVPAHASSLTVDVDPKTANFTCSFNAVYPSPTPPLTWRITKKSMRAKSLEVHPGRRFYAWISVEFDEVWMENGKERKHSYKIEGPVKPVIQHPPQKE
ncbi:hypothetical protein [Roseimicrobium gellanilyticum]|nr:hypothetical protein [Roseimicrobium gellanilyticum]